MIGNQEPEQATPPLLPGLATLLWQHRRAYGVALLSLLAVDLVGLAPPALVGLLVHSLTAEAGAGFSPLAIAGAYLGVFVVQGVLRYPLRKYSFGTALRVSTDVRAAYAKSLVSMPLDHLKRWPTGDLLARAGGELEAVEQAAGLALLITFDVLYYFISLPILMVILHPSLAVIAFLPMPLVPLLAYRFIRRIEKAFRASQDAQARATGNAEEAIAGAIGIRVHGAEREAIASFEEAAKEQAIRALALARFESSFSPTIQAILTIGTAAVLAIGGRKVIQGEIALGEFVTFSRPVPGTRRGSPSRWHGSGR